MMTPVTNRLHGGMFSSRGRELIAGAVILAVLAGALLPGTRRNFTSGDIARTIKGQPVILQVFSFASLPLDAIDRLFAEKNDLPEGKTKGTTVPRNDDPGAASSPSFSPGMADKKVNGSRYAAKCNVVPEGQGWGGCFLHPPGSPPGSGGVPLWRWDVFLAFIFSIFALPRSSVGDGALRAFCPA